MYSVYKKMEAATSTETLLPTSKLIRHEIPEDSNLPFTHCSALRGKTGH
jgi:hypothetical protein